MSDQKEPVASDSPDAETATETVNRRGRRLIISTAPGGVVPEYNAAISPATLVDGKAVGVSIGFRLSEASRAKLDELIDEAGMTQRSFLVQVLNEHLARKGRPPLDEPLFAQRRRKRLESNLPTANDGANKGIDVFAVAKAAVCGNAGDGSVPPISLGEAAAGTEVDDEPAPDEVRAAIRQLTATSQEVDLDQWMREHLPKRGLDQAASEIEKLVRAGYDWQQVHDYLYSVKRIETTPEILWEWWQQRLKSR